MRRLAPLLLALACAASALADPPKVPEPIKPAVGEDTTVEVAGSAGAKVGFRAAFDPADCTFFRGYSDDPARLSFLVRPKKPGVYRVVFWTANETASSVLVIDASGPAPPGPGPGPGPGPDPGPGPNPPAPIPDAGLHVMVILEKRDISALPAKQQLLLSSATVRAALNDRCAKDAKGRPCFRFWTKDMPVTEDEDPRWAKALARAQGKSYPWLIVSNGKTGFEGPLPADGDALLALVGKYAP